MDPTPTEFAFRFATSDLPEGERLPCLREIFGRGIVRLDIEPEQPFKLDVRLCILQPMSALRGRRAPAARGGYHA
jgi:hypothetical protein